MREEVAGQQPAYSPLLFSVLSPYGHKPLGSRSAPAARRGGTSSGRAMQGLESPQGSCYGA